MTPKRQALEEPTVAAASSSSEEEMEEDEEEEEEAEAESEEGKDKIVSTEPQSSSEDEGSDSDSGSKINKPIDETETETDELKKKSVTESKSKKRKKVVAEDTGKMSGGDPKKQLFQRLWSEDDEIVILKGMVDYLSLKGVDPWTDLNTFHDFIKKSLQVHVSKDQLINKIRRLKKKYKNHAAKGTKFSKPHDQETFDLSTKIWGGDVGVDQARTNGKERKKHKINDGLPFPRPEELAVQHPYLFEKNLNIVMPGVEENILKEALDKIGNSSSKELEEKWRIMKVTEIGFYLKWLELKREQMKLILGALNASNP